MVKAIWNGNIIAESDQTILVEGNHYFLPDSVNQGYLQESQKNTVCPWKGVASYYDIQVNKQVNQDAAWYSLDPSPRAKEIQNYVAFWRGVEIIESQGN